MAVIIFISFFIKFLELRPYCFTDNFVTYPPRIKNVRPPDRQDRRPFILKGNWTRKNVYLGVISRLYLTPVPSGRARVYVWCPVYTYDHGNSPWNKGNNTWELRWPITTPLCRMFLFSYNRGLNVCIDKFIILPEKNSEEWEVTGSILGRNIPKSLKWY